MHLSDLLLNFKVLSIIRTCYLMLNCSHLHTQPLITQIYHPRSRQRAQYTPFSTKQISISITEFVPNKNKSDADLKMPKEMHADIGVLKIQVNQLKSGQNISEIRQIKAFLVRRTLKQRGEEQESYLPAKLPLNVPYAQRFIVLTQQQPQQNIINYHKSEQAIRSTFPDKKEIFALKSDFFTVLAPLQNRLNATRATYISIPSPYLHSQPIFHRISTLIPIFNYCYFLNLIILLKLNIINPHKYMFIWPPLPKLPIFLALLSLAQPRCVYNIGEDRMPFHVDSQPFQIGPLSACKDYLQPGRLGCCNHVNDQLTLQNFKQIDSLFGTNGGGCDICAINLKRFWCHYACSARQHEFMWSSAELRPYSDPQKPGATILGQEVWVRVHSNTACALYNSCKRNPFVSSVSAMGSPAGFLNFQGHNALNGGHQYISMNFSSNISESLAFADELHDFPYDALTSCEFKTSQQLIHNFTFSENCTCGSCETACDPNDGFVYRQPEVFQGFNSKLVGGVYAVVAVIAVGLTVYRSFCGKRQRKEEKLLA